MCRRASHATTTAAPRLIATTARSRRRSASRWPPSDDTTRPSLPRRGGDLLREHVGLVGQRVGALEVPHTHGLPGLYDEALHGGERLELALAELLLVDPPHDPIRLVYARLR